MKQIHPKIKLVNIYIYTSLTIELANSLGVNNSIMIFSLSVALVLSKWQCRIVNLFIFLQATKYISNRVDTQTSQIVSYSSCNGHTSISCSTSCDLWSETWTFDLMERKGWCTHPIHSSGEWRQACCNQYLLLAGLVLEKWSNPSLHQ